LCGRTWGPLKPPGGWLARHARAHSCCSVQLLHAERNRQPYREHRAGTVATVSGGDQGPPGPGEAAPKREPATRTRAQPVALLHAIELVENLLKVAGWNAFALVDHLQINGLAFTPSGDADGGVRRRVFCRVVEQIEQYLFEQHRIEAQHGQVSGNIDLD